MFTCTNLPFSFSINKYTGQITIYKLNDVIKNDKIFRSTSYIRDTNYTSINIHKNKINIYKNKINIHKNKINISNIADKGNYTLIINYIFNSTISSTNLFINII